MVRAAPAPFPERGFLLGRLSNAGLIVPRPAPRKRPASETLHHCGHSRNESVLAAGVRICSLAVSLVLRFGNALRPHPERRLFRSRCGRMSETRNHAARADWSGTDHARKTPMILATAGAEAGRLRVNF